MKINNISFSTGKINDIISGDNIKKEFKDVVTLESSLSVTEGDLLKEMKENFEKRNTISAEKGSFERGKDTFINTAIQTSEYIDEHDMVKKSVNTSLKFFKTLKAFPSFIYPGLLNMTSEEKELLISTLDKLPLKDINSVKTITMKPFIDGASGLAHAIPSSPHIDLSRKYLNYSKAWAEHVIIHEVGHTRDFETSLFGAIGFESKGYAWGKPPYISKYASTNRWEDFAESFSNYYREPEKLKAQCPEKYARLQELEKSNFFEKLIDNEAFRETGKFIGKNLEKIPYIQNGLAMISYITGFLQVYRGLGEMAKGEKDVKSRMNGTLDFAAGLCFASKIFCVAGMAIDGAKQELNRAIDRQEITAEQAGAVIENTIGIIAGPSGKVINMILSKLPWRKLRKNNNENTETVSFENKSKDIRETGSLHRAAAIAAGGATGATAGGFIGPYLGVMGGFALAGPVGGWLGLIAGAIAGVTAGSRLGGKAGKAIGETMEKMSVNQPEER